MKGIIGAIIMAVITGVSAGYQVWSQHETDKKLEELNKKLDNH